MSKARVIVVGLGPAGPALVPPDTRALLAGSGPRFLRTARHPAAAEFALPTFDRLYEELTGFAEVYQAMASELVAAAIETGTAVLAVPGSPLVGESVVGLLAEDPLVELEVRPALSFLDLAWLRLGVDPLSVSAKLVDAASFARDAAGQAGPFLVGQCWSSSVLSEVKLAVEEPPAERVIILHHLGLEDELVAEVAWEDMDRSVEVDHLSSMWIPVLASPVASELVGLVELARVLRQRCPWDVEQTHHSLARHMREEAYELIDALARLGPEGQGDAELEEELGDVLYQVVFHCQIAAEEGRFNLADVARGLSDKLVGRHPHVFGSTVAADSDRVALNWEQIKKKEKGRASVMDGIIPELPALSLAQAVQRRSKGISGVEEPALSSSDEDEAGLLLWEAASRATTQGIDAEDALRRVALAWRQAYKERELHKLEAAGGAAAGPVGVPGPDDGD